MLIKHGVDVNQTIVGGFYSPGQNANKFETRTGRTRRSRSSRFFQQNGSTQKLSLKNANPESKFQNSFSSRAFHSLSLEIFSAHAYYGEYPLAFAAAFGYKEIYDYLIDHGADPNKQDTYGNTVLHMLVIRDRSVR